MIAEYELSREADERLYVSLNQDGVCPLHFHRKIELVYIQSGHKTIICDDKKYFLESDQIFVADSYVMHSYEKSEDSTQIIIVLPNHMLRDYYLLYGNCKIKNCVLLDKDICRAMKPLFLALAKKNPNPLINQGRIDQLMGHIVDTFGVEPREEIYDHKFIEEVLAYIQENYREEITLDTLADHFNYSKYYFSRIFNSYLHTNITNYLSMIRLQAAIEMLKNGKVNVSDAALEAGFASIQTFYRAAKKHYKYDKIKDLVNVGSKITDIANFTEETDPSIIRKLNAHSEDGE
ncbi:MAG: AraC family transcriptional regulator [Clostridia bacterium]|nr:AraC family transcriptional regulator [Clostridia bacterium]